TDSQLTHMGDLYYMATTKAMNDMYTSMVAKIKNTQQYLYQQQPLAIVTKNNNGRDGTLFTNNGTGAYKKDVNPGPPQLVLSTEDYMRLRRLLDDGSTPELEMDISVKFSTTDLGG